jgi:hypothetical protein
MIGNSEKEERINIIRLLRNSEILHAMNAAVKDVYDSGLRPKKFLKTKQNTNYDLLISLIAAL